MSNSQLTYAGVDASRRGWIAIRIDTAGFVDALLRVNLGELLSELDSRVIAIDIPMGLDSYPRRADAVAAAFVGPRRSSVFRTPPRDVLEAPDYGAARMIAREKYGIGVSSQAFSLAPRILEADTIAKNDGRLIEVHPEVSFAALVGEPLAFTKKTWGGHTVRAELLAREGIEVPVGLGDAGHAGPDDVLDAAVAARSARRYGAGHAGRLPENPEDGEPVIFY